MYNFTLRSFVKYLRSNGYSAIVLNGIIWINDWYIKLDKEFEYITISHPALFPNSLSFYYCDFDKAIRKLHAFTKIAVKLNTNASFKPLTN